MNSEIKKEQQRVSAEKFLEQINDSVRRFDAIARTSATEERAAEIITTEIERMYAALMSMPIRIDSALFKSSLACRDEQIAAVRSLIYDQSRDSYNKSLRFTRSYEHELRANAAYNELLEKMRETETTGVPAEPILNVDGSLFLMELLSKQRETPRKDKSLPRGDYRTSVENGDFDAVYDITVAELDALIDRTRRENAESKLATEPITIFEPELFEKPVPLFDVKNAFQPGMRRRQATFTPRRGVQEFNTTAATRANISRAEKETPPKNSPTMPVGFTAEEATHEANLLFQVLEKARANYVKPPAPQTTVKTGVKDRFGNEIPGTESSSALLSLSESGTFTQLKVFESVQNAWARGDGNLITSLYNLYLYLFQQKDAVQRELNDNLKSVEEQLTRIDKLRGNTPQLLAFAILRDVQKIVFREVEHSTKTQLLVNRIYIAYSKRLEFYDDLYINGKYTEIINNQLAFLQKAQREIISEIQERALNDQERLDKVKRQIELEQQRNRTRQNLPEQPSTPINPPSQFAEQKNTQILQDAVKFNNSVVISAQSSEIVKVLDNPVSVPINETEITERADEQEVVEELQELRAEEELEEVVEEILEQEEELEEEAEELFPTEAMSPTTIEFARIDDIPLWRRGFRGELAPWYVTELFANPFMADDEKIRLVGQLYVYIQSVGTLYRGGDRPIFAKPLSAYALEDDAGTFLANTPFAILVEQRIEATSGADYISTPNLLRRLEAMQSDDPSRIIMPNEGVLAGEQLRVLPTSRLQIVERDAALKFIKAFVEEAREQKLDSAYVLGPVLTNMRLLDNSVEAAQQTLRIGATDDDTTARIDLLFEEQSATIIELSRGILNNVAAPIEEAKRNLTDGLYRSAAGNEDHIVLYTECDASQIDQSLAGKGLRARVSYYKAPFGDRARQEEINATLALLTSDTEPYHVFWSIEDTPFGDRLPEGSSPLIVQSHQRVRWNETTRAQMFDLRKRSTIVITLLSPNGTLLQELMNMPMDTSNVTSIPPSSSATGFIPQYTPLGYINDINSQQSLVSQDSQIFLRNTLDYMLSEQIPEVLDARNTAVQVAAMQQAAAELRDAQQYRITRGIRYLVNTPQAIFAREADALYQDRYADSAVTTAVMVYVALRVVSKMFFLVAHFISAWGLVTNLVSNTKTRIIQCAKSIATKIGISVSAQAVSEVSKTLSYNNVQNPSIWRSVTSLARAIGTNARDYAGGVVDIFSSATIIPGIGKLIAALQRHLASAAHDSIVMLNSVRIGIGKVFEYIGGLVSFYAVGNRMGARVIRIVLRAQNFIDMTALLFSGVLMASIFTGGGVSYFALELTHQMISGYIQLVAFRYLRYGLDSLLRYSNRFENILNLAFIVGVSTWIIAPWITGSEYIFYGLFRSPINYFLLPTRNDNVQLTTTGGAGVYYLATIGARSAAAVFMNITLARQYRDTRRTLPLEETIVWVVTGSNRLLNEIYDRIYPDVRLERPGEEYRRPPRQMTFAPNYRFDTLREPQPSENSLVQVAASTPSVARGRDINTRLSSPRGIRRETPSMTTTRPPSTSTSSSSTSSSEESLGPIRPIQTSEPILSRRQRISPTNEKFIRISVRLLGLIYQVDDTGRVFRNDDLVNRVSQVNNELPLIIKRIKNYLAIEPHRTEILDIWQSMENVATAGVDAWLRAVTIHWMTTDDNFNQLARVFTKDPTMTAELFVQTYQPIVERLERNLLR